MVKPLHFLNYEDMFFLIYYLDRLFERYIVLTILLLNGFEITLTLPGIAGIILSIGMAVDANVIIFARIRPQAITESARKSAARFLL